MLINGDVINRQYVIQEHLGVGRFSIVYKVLDSINQKTIALKIMKNEDQAILQIIRNERAMLEVLDHPNIIKSQDILQIHDLETEGGTELLLKYFMPMEYIQSTALDKLVTEKKISLKQAKDYMFTLLEIVKYIESKHIIHRDISTKNILISDRGPILIDFNVGRVIDENTGTVGIGTRPYVPPEAEIRGWKLGGDQYSLGVVVYEMITGTLPFQSPYDYETKRTPIDPSTIRIDLNEDIGKFLLKWIAFDPNDRFQTIDEIKEAAQAVNWETKWTYRGVKLHLEILRRDLSDPDCNPYLNDLLSIYSQSKLTNSGTRGLDEFTNAVYVRTLLDDRLTEMIKNRKYKLVVITGNAGDGKTAFIQSFENEMINSDHNGNVIKHDKKSNGRVIIEGGWKYYTNYDGSQDEGDKKNDDVLLEFFDKFKGDQPSQADNDTYVIAINEGRLKDFLYDHKVTFSYLYEKLVGALDLGSEMDDNILLVNLNERQLVFPDETNISIFDKIMATMITDDIWKQCKGCSIVDKCYVKFNVDSMRNPQFGTQIIERMRELFQIAHLRRILHITIRDLRSALSYILFSTSTCAEIHALVNGGSNETISSRFYYNAIFDQKERSIDRTIEVLNAVDPGRTPDPMIERRIREKRPSLNPAFTKMDQRSTIDNEILDEFFNAQEVGELDKEETIFVSRSLKRKLFFETLEPGWNRLLPYKQKNEFIELIKNGNSNPVLEAVKNKLLNAISRTEDPTEKELSEQYLLIRNRKEIETDLKSYKGIKKDKFHLTIENIGGGETRDHYIEETPSHLSLIYDERASLRLDLDMDLFELLFRILDGYYPSINELRGSFINLMIFKNQLANEVQDTVIIKATTGERAKVYKGHDNTLILETI